MPRDFRDHTNILAERGDVGGFLVSHHFSLVVGMIPTFVDIHCHLLFGIDDGAKSIEESFAMAHMAVEDGIRTIIATPHQLGSYSENEGGDIRCRVERLQRELDSQRIPLRVLPGADIRIEDGLSRRLREGNVLTLGNHGRHVLLELPHELYLPLEPVIGALARQRMVGILSHPERNKGILRQPSLLGPLVDSGCLMQVTAASICGAFGPNCQRLAERMVCDGLVHFIATDAHGASSRRPLMGPAYHRVCALAGDEVATALFCQNPARVAEGRTVAAGRLNLPPRRRGWLGMRKVAG